jgi:hypothetical protein
LNFAFGEIWQIKKEAVIDLLHIASNIDVANFGVHQVLFRPFVSETTNFMSCASCANPAKKALTLNAYDSRPDFC